MEQNKEQDQGDELAAETRRLLDAATELTAEWYIERTYNKRVPDHWSVDVLSDDDHVCSVRGGDEGAHAEDILAALTAAGYEVVHVPAAPDKRTALHTLGLTDEDIAYAAEKWVDGAWLIDGTNKRLTVAIGTAAHEVTS